MFRFAFTCKIHEQKYTEYLFDTEGLPKLPRLIEKSIISLSILILPFKTKNETI